MDESSAGIIGIASLIVFVVGLFNGGVASAIVVASYILGASIEMAAGRIARRA
jgi:hypothetical protein